MTEAWVAFERFSPRKFISALRVRRDVSGIGWVSDRWGRWSVSATVPSWRWRWRIAKPDPAIYERLEADCGVVPGRLLFADDRADNIAAAKARGWQGHLFDGPDGWAHTLVRTGLLTEEEAK